MKKAKKKVKGMTLIECIIAMMVAGIAGLVMCEVGSVTCRLMRNTNHVNNKTNVEAPTAKVQDSKTLNDSGVTGEDQTIVVSCGGKTASVQVQKYSTESLVPKNDDGSVQEKYQVNANGDIEFYVIETTPVT